MKIDNIVLTKDSNLPLLSISYDKNKNLTIGLIYKIIWYRVNNKLHRSSKIGPASIHIDDGFIEYFKKDKMHRNVFEGPAYINHIQNKKEYWINGIQVSKPISK